MVWDGWSASDHVAARDDDLVVAVVIVVVAVVVAAPAIVAVGFVARGLAFPVAVLVGVRNFPAAAGVDRDLLNKVWCAAQDVFEISGRGAEHVNTMKTTRDSK